MKNELKDLLNFISNNNSSEVKNNKFLSKIIWKEFG